MDYEGIGTVMSEVYDCVSFRDSVQIERYVSIGLDACVARFTYKRIYDRCH